MSKKITKLKDPPTPPVCEENSLGLSPAVLGKRGLPKTEDWCPKPNPLLIYFDPACDPYNPKALQYKDVHKAYEFVKKKIPKSPLMKSNGCAEFDMHLYFKTESLQKTGSFRDRSARYALEMLSTEQRRDGVYTSSLGNWGMALAYHAHKLGIPVTVVYPTSCLLDTVQKCKDYGAHVVKFGTNLTEAHREALNIIKEKGVLQMSCK